MNMHNVVRDVFNLWNKNHVSWDFPGSPVVDSALPLWGVQVRSLVGELRSHMPRSPKKKKKNHVSRLYGHLVCIGVCVCTNI